MLKRGNCDPWARTRIFLTEYVSVFSGSFFLLKWGVFSKKSIFGKIGQNLRFGGSQGFFQSFLSGWHPKF